MVTSVPYSQVLRFLTGNELAIQPPAGRPLSHLAIIRAAQMIVREWLPPGSTNPADFRSFKDICLFLNEKLDAIRTRKISPTNGEVFPNLYRATLKDIGLVTMLVAHWFNKPETRDEYRKLLAF